MSKLFASSDERIGKYLDVVAFFFFVQTVSLSNVNITHAYFTRVNRVKHTKPQFIVGRNRHQKKKKKRREKT